MNVTMRVRTQRRGGPVVDAAPLRARIITIVLALVAGAVFVGGHADAGAARTTTSVISPAVQQAMATAASNQYLPVVVRMAASATLPDPGRKTRRSRQRAVIQALETTADTTQAALRAALDAAIVDGSVQSYEPLWIVNAIAVRATPAAITALAQRSDVRRIVTDRASIVLTDGVGVQAETGVSAVGAPSMWASGHDGTGAVVAVLDTGVDVSHPDLASQFRGGTNSWFDPYGQHAAPVDLSGHGTAVAGAIVGGTAGGTAIGVAPGAKYIAARIFDDSGHATVSAIHAALQWVLDPDQDPNTADGPHVVNSSWSYGSVGCDTEFQSDIQALRSAGIIPVFAAGNFGPYGSSSASPANYPESLSVGAVTDAGAAYAYSSRGPTTCGSSASRTFPTLVAPGVNVWTTEKFGTYAYETGTSIAAPSVTGALALLVGAGVTGLNGDPEAALKSTAVDLGAVGVDDVFGAGRIDVAAAYAAAVSATNTTTSTTTTTHSATTTTTSTTTTTEPATTTTTVDPNSTTTTVDPNSTTTTVDPNSTTTTVDPNSTTTTVDPTTTTTEPPTTTTTTTTTEPPTTTTTSTTTTTTTTTVPPTTTTTTTLPPPPAALFADGFESGTTAAWTSASTASGRLTVATSAALQGTYGMRADIRSRTAMYVADATPSALSQYQVSLQFDPNTVTMGTSSMHEVLRVQSSTGLRVAAIEIRRTTAGYQLRAAARTSTGSTVTTTWATITDAPHALTLAWRAGSTSTKADGSVVLGIDASKVSKTGIKTGTLRVETLQVGPQTITSGISGVEYYDAVTTTQTPTLVP